MVQKLSPDGRRFVLFLIFIPLSSSSHFSRGFTYSHNPLRIRTIIITAPFLVASSLLLYKRLVLGQEQRKLPRPPVSPMSGAQQVKPDEFEGAPAEVAARIREAEEKAKR